MEGKTSVLKIVLCTVAAVLLVEILIIGTLGARFKQKSLKNVYNAGMMGYKIGYPEDWKMDYQQNQTVTFQKTDKTSKEKTEVTLENILADNAGGQFNNVDEIISALKTQIVSSEGELENENLIIRTTESGRQLIGQQFEAKYALDSKSYHLWQVVIPSSNENFFYKWTYSAPENTYRKNMPSARAMLGSWIIN